MIYDLMNDLGDYASENGTMEFLPFWNRWVTSGVDIPPKALPMMMAMARELSTMDRTLLHEIRSAIQSLNERGGRRG